MLSPKISDRAQSKRKLSLPERNTMLLDFDISVQPTRTTPEENDLFFGFQRRRLWMSQRGGGLEIPPLKQVLPLLPPEMPLFPLAMLEGQCVFALPPFQEAEFPEGAGLCWVETSVFRELPPREATLLMTCLHLWNWYQSHHFCGSCGGKNAPEEGVRALKCSSCGRETFPVIAPAIIVAITHGDEILRVESKLRPGHWGLVAGYVEPGETLEHAVFREVGEEVGLTIQKPRYIGDQPWGFSGSHMFAFHAECEKPEPLRLQEEELSQARWFRREELPKAPQSISIAGQLVEAFQKGEL